MIYSLSRADTWTTEDFRRVLEAEAAIYFDRPGGSWEQQPLLELERASHLRWGWAWIWEQVIEEHKARRAMRRQAALVGRAAG